MVPEKIRLTIKSAATFGRGDSVPGLIHREIEHDGAGFPFLRGKTLKGLLAESAENIVFSLEALQKRTGWRAAKDHLFGLPGQGIDERGLLHIGDAVLPSALRAEICSAGWSVDEVMYSLTGIRRQTAVNPHGAPESSTLRSMRVLLPGITLEAQIMFEKTPGELEEELLVAAVLDFRRAGIGRNRGRGWLTAELDNDEATRQMYRKLEEAVR